MTNELRHLMQQKNKVPDLDRQIGSGTIAANEIDKNDQKQDESLILEEIVIEDLQVDGICGVY